MLARAVGILALLAVLGNQQAQSQDQRTVETIVTLGSGPIGGAYYSAARLICDQYRSAAGSNHRCSPDPTPGSLYNIEALTRGELDFALVQSDQQKEAYQGTGHFSGRGPTPNLRSVMALFPEPLTILVRSDASIESITDLVGRRVDRGRSISGRRATVDKLLEEVGLEPSELGELTEYTWNVAANELCAGRLDAVFLIIGHPNPTVADVLSTCDVSLIGLDENVVSSFVAQNPDYSPDNIPAGTYPGLAVETNTFSVMATIVTRSEVPDEAVLAMALAILENTESGGVSAPITKIDPTVSVGLTAPIHDAAQTVLNKSEAVE